MAGSRARAVRNIPMELHLILLMITGVVAGFMNVMAGGGSLLTLPVMLEFLGMEAPLANGTNRVAIEAGAVNAVWGFRRQGFSDFKLSLTLAVCALPGAFVGAKLGCQLEGVLFRQILAGVMIAVMILMAWNKKKGHQATERIAPTRTRLIIAHLCMVGVGFYGGIIQVGVGFILITVLDKVLGLDLLRVSIHKVFIVAVYTVVALSVYAGQGNVAIVPGVALAGGAAAGSWIGTHFAVQKGDRLIRICLNLALVGLVMKLLLSQG